ncbi:MAG: hypothetical protein ACXWQO_18985 [Bdellovibrionota bacterium]
MQFFRLKVPTLSLLTGLTLILCSANCFAEEISSSLAADKVAHALSVLAEAAEGTKLQTIPDSSLVRFVKLRNDNEWLCGFAQFVRFKANVKKLTAVMADINSYQAVLKGLIEAKVTKSSGPDDFTLYTETDIPVPLVANDKTSVHYHLSHVAKNTLYRYSLESGNHLKEFEGAAAAIALSSSESLYIEVDFLQAGNGASRILPAARFCRENVLGNIQSDLAFKIKAEKPGTASEIILAESEAASEKMNSELVELQKNPLSLAELLALFEPEQKKRGASGK